MMLLSQAAHMLDAEFSGDDVLFSAVSKDTRKIIPGDLYIALKGAHFDGHEFMQQAASAGAVAALVSADDASPLPKIKVADTRLALGKLAAGWRQRFQGGVIGITGSNGKTTVKEMCRCILAEHTGEAHVLSTRGNLNNDIGMPMTLLELRNLHRYAVIEMGANHAGEIDYLTHIAQPDVAVITNAGQAHLEGFGSVANVARAKGEIYSGLRDEGIAVINLDDEYTHVWQTLCAHRQRLGFSLQSTAADVYASNIDTQADASRFILNTAAGNIAVSLPLPGVHNIMNALAAAAACTALGVSVKHIAAALTNFVAVSGRLNIKLAHNGARVIDDTYNANPLSLHAAMRVLVGMSGKPWLVMGDMAELGANSAELHFAAGAQAKKLGIERLFAIGKFSSAAVQAFGNGAEHFADHAALIDKLVAVMRADNVVLIKGSRAMTMEHVVNAIVAPAVDTFAASATRQEVH